MYNDYDKQDKKSSSDWPAVAFWVIVLLIVIALCFGNRILDWLGAPS